MGFPEWSQEGSRGDPVGIIGGSRGGAGRVPGESRKDPGGSYRGPGG